MQFQYNADYPGVQPDGSFVRTEARNPLEFPPAQPLPCARITTRVFHPARQQVATVQNVLVRTIPQPPRHRSGSEGSGSSDIMSSSSSDSDDMDEDEQMQDGDQEGQPSEPRAYWLQRTIREAIYGRVATAIILRKRRQSTDDDDDDDDQHNNNAEWEVTDQRCAVKEMSWQHIRRERSRLAEDPIKEVAAMQYIKRWYEITKQAAGHQNLVAEDSDTVQASFQAMKETNIMMPLDLLSDDRNLYSIMPFCDGGELFERLDMNERFTEEEARYWMNQVLNGLENLQNAGICHRDMSLENMLVHESGALIIDLGMCLRIPLASHARSTAVTTSTKSLTNSLNMMTVSGGSSGGGGGGDGGGGGRIAARSNPIDTEITLAAKQHRRFLIRPQGTCGKWIYMSPEIYKNKEAFDAYSVDMWAAGVILFLMLTGFPPWERASQTDERFRYMTGGYLVQMLTEWEIGISSDAMDLLQRMFFIDPKDRLSLEQVRAHPWMVNGRSDPPAGGFGQF